MKYIENEEFARKDYTQTNIAVAEYDNCIFKECNFYNSDLSNIEFIDCQFYNCDLSMATIKKTSFKDVGFYDCKMLGLKFNTVNPFLLSLGFNNCILDYSIFNGLALKATAFVNCSLKEVDFSNANLSESVFDNCDFIGATIEFTNLQKADLRTAYNFEIDPDQNKIKGAKFSKENVSGLLGKFGVKIE